MPLSSQPSIPMLTPSPSLLTVIVHWYCLPDSKVAFRVKWYSQPPTITAMSPNCLLEEMDNQNKNTAAAGCALPPAEQKPGLTGESARKSGKMKNFTWKLLEMRSGKCIFVIWSGGVR